MDKMIKLHAGFCRLREKTNMDKATSNFEVTREPGLDSKGKEGAIEN